MRERAERTGVSGFLLEDAWNALYGRDLVRVPWDGLEPGAQVDACVILATLLMAYDTGGPWPGVKE